MQNLIISTSALLLGFSFLAAIMCLKSKEYVHHFFWSLVGIATFVGGCLATMRAVRALPYTSPVMLWATIVLFVLGTLFWLALLLTSGGHRKPGERSLGQRLKFVAQVALPSWKSLDTSQFREEDRRQAGRISLALNIGAAVVVFPGIALVLAVSIIMNINSSKTSDFISHAVGFYTLLLATCWTLAYIVTIGLVALLQIIRGNGRDLTVAAVGISLGTWAGFGAAGGVFVGALVPLIVVPLAGSPLKLLGVSLLDSVSPSLLLDISAAGAVFGFLLGEVISLIDISGGEKNLYIKAAAPPLTFAILATALGGLGIAPGRLATVLANEYNKTVLSGVNTDGTDPFKIAVSQGLDTQEGWASVVSGFEQHGWNQLVDRHVYYLVTWIVAILVVLFALTIKVRAREERLLGLDRSDKHHGEDKGEGVVSGQPSSSGKPGEGASGAQPAQTASS